MRPTATGARIPAMKDVTGANANRISRFLGKPAADFTRQDLVKFIEANDIQVLNFRHIGGDGRLKTLNLPVTSRADLDRLLSMGERVDGSSLLPHVDAASSDLYVVPRYGTAYVNPFCDTPAMDVLCSYYTSEGKRLSSAPENIVRKAQEALRNSTGLTLEAMGELEYYVIHDSQQAYPVKAQKGYHESSPFCKWERLRCEAMVALSQAGVAVKYGHSEVGNISGNGRDMEQHEIELLPVPAEDAADHVAIAMWMLRMLGHKHGVTVTFAPKILAGHAGNGLHIHTRLVRNGTTMMTEGNRLSETARKAIAGHLTLAPSLTAFGNTVPTSYLRLVPHQEAPTHICWGDRNRSVLVRVPLGWLNVADMARDANPRESGESPAPADNQTVEIRCPDGSANIYLLLAGLAVAARHGLEMEDSLEVADRLFVDVNIFAPEHKELQQGLPHLPASCWDSADLLLQQRDIYQRDGVFSPAVIDQTVAKLKSYDDKNLSQRLHGREDEVGKLIEDFLYCP